MATKSKTKAGRAAERKSTRSQASNRKGEAREASSSAIEVLEQDHRQVEEWFDEYEELEDKDDDRKADLAEKICLALKVHAQVEEEVFYPRAREATKDNDLIDELLVEHATVKNLIREIGAMEVGDELYDAKIPVLGEMVKHHIKEEEEELFPELESSQNRPQSGRQRTCGTQGRADVGNSRLNNPFQLLVSAPLFQRVFPCGSAGMLL